MCVLIFKYNWIVRFYKVVNYGLFFVYCKYEMCLVNYKMIILDEFEGKLLVVVNVC